MQQNRNMAFLVEDVHIGRVHNEMCTVVIFSVRREVRQETQFRDFLDRRLKTPVRKRLEEILFSENFG